MTFKSQESESPQNEADKDEEKSIKFHGAEMVNIQAHRLSGKE